MNAELEAEIDERQRAEQSLLAARGQLEETVLERTNELSAANAQLQRLNATLEQRVQEEVEKNREQERIIPTRPVWQPWGRCCPTSPISGVSR